MDNDIYIGTILLEKNRWAKPKTPTYRVCDWVDRFAAAGFAGMELWEYHESSAAADAAAALRQSPVPVAVYNTYCSLGADGGPDRARVAAAVRRYAAGGIKFNVGNAAADGDVYLANLRAWAAALPSSCRLLCECHPGTIIETPAAARQFFDVLMAEDPRWQIIVHCFGDDLDRLREWFRRFGDRITHAHVQLSGGERQRLRLERRPEHVHEALRIMSGEGFAGTFTLEFTEGTGRPDETIDDLWQAALADLAFLRSASL